MKYTVHEHGQGRSGYTLSNGQIWENDLGGHEWRATSGYMKKQEAIEAADAVSHHAVVVNTQSGEKIHDNGKAPRSRIDW